MDRHHKPHFKIGSEFHRLVTDAHQEGGCSLRDLALTCRLNFAYIWQILNGQRCPSRDVVIVLCLCGWKLNLDRTDAILQSVGYKPLQGASKSAAKQVGTG